MTEYLGDRTLLDLPKTAFLASGTVPPELVLRCYDWAQRMGRAGGGCVVSGFSSHVEERVLRLLLRGTQPIVVVLARRMYRRVPPEWQPHVDSGRMLIVAASASARQSRATAQARNRYVCQLADRIVIVGPDEGTSLAELRCDFAAKLCPLTPGMDA